VMEILSEQFELLRIGDGNVELSTLERSRAGAAYASWQTHTTVVRRYYNEGDQSLPCTVQSNFTRQRIMGLREDYCCLVTLLNCTQCEQLRKKEKNQHTRHIKLGISRVTSDQTGGPTPHKCRNL